MVEALEARRFLSGTPFLPDLTPWANVGNGQLYGWNLDTTTMPGHTLLRLASAIANIGTGPMELNGGSVNPDSTQNVNQRIYESDGSFIDRLAGTFTYHPTHQHTHFEDFAQYNLRTITAGGGVGGILAGGIKTSFCLEDIRAYDLPVAGAAASPVYTTCGTGRQGISAGWADIYRSSLDGQWIDVTGVGPGDYWLETVANPDNHILESNTANNVARIRINLFRSADNTLTSAQNLGQVGGTQTLSGFVGNVDTQAFYRFTVGASTPVSLALAGLSNDADLLLLDSAGNTLVKSSNYNATDEYINRTLATGTYYIRVYQYSGNTGYNLTLSTAAGQHASLAAAQDIGTPGAGQSFTGFMGPTNTQDFYKFTLASPAQVNVTLAGLSSDADLLLLDSTGNTLAKSSNNNTADEQINRALPAGTYYLRIYQYAGNTSYNLTIGRVSPPTTDDTLATARDAGSLTGTQTFSDLVGSFDTQDFYRFTVSVTTPVTVALAGLSSNADLRLLDSAGNTLVVSSNPSTADELISRTLSPGTYYVRAYQFSGDTSYWLSLSVDGAGNSLAAARDLGTLSGARQFRDFVGSPDTNDYYRFTLASAAQITATLTGLSADLDLQLLDSAGNMLAKSSRYGAADEMIVRSLAAGTYYLRAYQYTGNSSYALAVSTA